MLGTLVLQAVEVKFLSDHYSLTFPDDWKKAELPNDKMLLAQQNADGSAMITVSHLEVPEKAKADLAATANSRLDALKKGTKVLKSAEPTPGKVDGMDALFLSVLYEVGEGKEAGKISNKMVFIDCGREVVILDISLNTPVPPEAAKASLEVIQSFRKK